MWRRQFFLTHDVATDYSNVYAAVGVHPILPLTDAIASAAAAADAADDDNDDDTAARSIFHLLRCQITCNQLGENCRASL